MERPACVYGVVWCADQSPGDLAIGLSRTGEAIQMVACSRQPGHAAVDVLLTEDHVRRLRAVLSRAMRGYRAHQVAAAQEGG